MLPVQLFNNYSYSLRVEVKAFWVGGEGLGFAVADFLVVSHLGSACSIAGGCVSPLDRVLWLAAVRLGISVWTFWDLQ